MRLLIVLASVALASAMQGPKPVELPAAAASTVVEQKIDATAKNLLINADSTLEAVKLKVPTLTEPVILSPSPTSADEVVPVRVAEIAPVEAVKVMNIPDDVVLPSHEPSPIPVKVTEYHTQDLPHYSPEAMRELYPNPMSLIDIGTLFAPEEVMREVANMDRQETDAVNVGGPHPFSFDNAEPLDNNERVNVVDSPVNQLDSNMDPVVVIESPSEEQPPFAEMPEAVKVVDISGDVQRPIPVAYWRGPSPTSEEKWKVPSQIPQEFLREIPQEILKELSVNYRPRPPYYRDVPRNEYMMPAPVYNDPTLR